MRLPIVVSALVMCPAFVSAQELCSEVLRYAARNVTLDVQEDTVGRIMYDNLCQGKQLKEGAAFDGEAAFPIDAIPVKFTLGAQGSREKASNLCKSFGEKLEADSSRYEYANLASNEAISAWKECALFARRDQVAVKPSVTPAFVLLNVEKLTANPVKITSILTSGGLSCKANMDGADVPTSPVSEFTSKTLNDASHWQVICERNGERQDDGTIVIGHADIGIATDRGPFIFQIPPETISGPATASELRGEIEAVRAEARAAAKNANEMIDWSAEKDGGKCAKMDMMQICYGSIFPVPNHPTHGSMRVLDIKFPKKFASPPVLASAFGASAGPPDANSMLVHEFREATAEGVSIVFHSKIHVNFNNPVRFNYIAVGPHE